MNTPIKLNRWIVWPAVVILVAVVLVACGGGDRSQAQPEQSRAIAMREKARSGIAWAPEFVAHTANPGSRQGIPVTFTARESLANVVVTVVPELRGLVTVSPSSFPTVQVGQTVTVTVTVAPSATQALRVVDGTIRLQVGNSTIANPLPVTVTVVAPEIVNGIAVPPEPPANLNNATLAGFDANGNGVRDDIERLIASRYGTNSARVAFTTSVAKAMQAMFVSPTPQTFSAYINTMRCVFDNTILVDAIVVERAMLSTGARKGVYGEVTAGSSIDEEGC